MDARSDAELLRAYAEGRSESAFAELVRRRVDLVYSTAVRMVVDPDLARDVTQKVFIALAQNAPQLANRQVLSGWLHRTAQNIAAETVRTDVRRRAREQESARMNEILSAEPDAEWDRIVPHLDAALAQLHETDRDAIMLRYFERKSAREMAELLGIGDEAAQKRVSRAVDRLRECLAKRGVAVGAGGLVALISANAVQSAPLGLAASISTIATVAGTSVAPLAAATKAIAMTTFHKIILGAALTGAVGVGIYGAHENAKLRGTVQALQAQQSQLTERVAQLQRERDDATARLAGMADQNDLLRTNAAELLKLRGEVSRLQLDSEELAQIKSGRSAAAVGAANAWADRVTLLKKRLEQTPDAAIPELQYATEKDWLNAARGDLNSDASYRRALSQLRNAGEQTFAVMLQKALKDYLRNNADQMPTDINQLAPFFASPVDPTMLQRWQVVSADSVKGLNMGSDVVITQRSAVDDVFDSRIGIGPNGWGTTDILSREVASTMDPVWQAYRAAHDGQWPDDVSQLQPYAHTPEQLAALQKLILHNTATKEQ